MDEQATCQLATYLKRVQAALSPGVATDVTSLRGEPAAVLEDLAVSGTIDLMVMATHRRGGLRRLVLGSMADRLVRLGAPALLVRPATLVTPDGAHAVETPLRSTTAS